MRGVSPVTAVKVNVIDFALGFAVFSSVQRLCRSCWYPSTVVRTSSRESFVQGCGQCTCSGGTCDILWVGQRCGVATDAGAFDKDVGKIARSAGAIASCVDMQKHGSLGREGVIVVICYGSVLAASAAIVQRIVEKLRHGCAPQNRFESIIKQRL